MDDFYISLVDFSYSNIVAVALEDAVYVWNAASESAELLSKFDDSAFPTLVKWSQEGKFLSSGLSDGSLKIFDVSKKECDAALITIADAVMSLVGGVAVFSVLGFMAKKLDLPIDQVVQSGTGLAFVAYPEALSRMPISWLWGLLFFTMIWTLGVSTQFGFAECICTALSDQFPGLRTHKVKTVVGVCLCLFFCGLVLCTRSGIYYFNILNDYGSSFALTLALFLEIISICYIYGYQNYIDDLRSMFGPPTTKLAAIIGPSGKYVTFVWRFLCPLQAVIIFTFSLLTQITYDMTYGKGSRVYVLPRWSVGLGWFISLLPLLWLPAAAAYRAYAFRRKGERNQVGTSTARSSKNSYSNGSGFGWLRSKSTTSKSPANDQQTKV